MKTVLVSYSSKDKEFVRKLASDLASYGLKLWIDEAEIKAGESLVAKISEGLEQSDVILIVLSKDSINSTWVQQEVRTALARDVTGANRVLIPVKIDDVEIPLFLRHILYVDLSTPENYQQGVRSIIKAVLMKTSDKVSSPAQLFNIGDLAKEVAKELSQILSIEQKLSEQENNTDNNYDENLVFVIISFSSDMEAVFEGIQAAGDKHGLRVERVKDVMGDYRITDKIIEMIQKSRLIVADLTHERPNVYFELGYARGLGKTVITTAREGTAVHFDVKDWTCTFYNDSRVLERHLIKRFEFELRKV